MDKIRVRREVKRIPFYTHVGQPVEEIIRIKEVAEAEDWEELTFKLLRSKRSSMGLRYFPETYELIITGMRMETDDELKCRKDRECELLTNKKEILVKAQKDVDELKRSLGSMTNCQ